MVILDGKKVSNDIKDEIAEKVNKMKTAVTISGSGVTIWLTCALYT